MQRWSVDGSGNVYVADTGNATLRKITPAGVVPSRLAITGDSLVITDSNAILLLRHGAQSW